MTLNLLAFVSAAVLEIAGCFAFWMWLRQGRSSAIAVSGVLSLVAINVVAIAVSAAVRGSPPPGPRLVLKEDRIGQTP